MARRRRGPVRSKNTAASRKRARLNSRNNPTKKTGRRTRSVLKSVKRKLIILKNVLFQRKYYLKKIGLKILKIYGIQMNTKL